MQFSTYVKNVAHLRDPCKSGVSDPPTPTLGHARRFGNYDASIQNTAKSPATLMSLKTRVRVRVGEISVAELLQ